jgi:hypothetical protein
VFRAATREESALAAPGAHPVRASSRSRAAAPTCGVPDELAETADPLHPRALIATEPPGPIGSGAPGRVGRIPARRLHSPVLSGAPI